MNTELLNWCLNGVFLSSLVYWGYKRTKPPATAYGIDGKGNVQGTGNTVHFHPPTRELTPTEQSFKETIDLLAVQLHRKQEVIDRYDREFCQMKAELSELRDYKTRHNILEFKHEKVKRKLAKYGIKLPIREIQLTH